MRKSIDHDPTRGHTSPVLAARETTKTRRNAIASWRRSRVRPGMARQDLEQLEIGRGIVRACQFLGPRTLGRLLDGGLDLLLSSDTYLYEIGD